MATSTEVAIATYTLTSATSPVIFNSIPGTYTDLRLVVVPIGATGDCRIRFNNDSSALYSEIYIAGEGSSASSGRYTDATNWTLSAYNTMSPSYPDMRTVDIFSYTGSTYKTGLGTETVDRNGSGSTARDVLLYRSTSAITRLDVYTVGDAFQSGSTLTLYGIL